MLEGAGVLHLGDRTRCTVQHSGRQRGVKGEKLRAGWTAVGKLSCTWNCVSHSSMEIFSDKHGLDSIRSTKCGEIRELSILNMCLHNLKWTDTAHREEINHHFYLWSFIKCSLSPHWKLLNTRNEDWQRHSSWVKTLPCWPFGELLRVKSFWKSSHFVGCLK